MERLQKIIAQSGYCSRRKAEEFIEQGRVSVNGTIVTELGTKANYTDKIAIDGQLIKAKEEAVTFVFHKPKNVLSTVSDTHGRECIADCFKYEPYRLFPVGRLDYESSGLILVSNDGEFTNLMIHPKYHIGKVYEVTIDGLLSDQDILQLKKGIPLEDGITAPCKVNVEVIKPDKPLMKLRITLYEGKNREIRRMMAYFGCNVKRLCRVEFGHIGLGRLKPGEYRRLRKEEKASLIKQAKTQTL